MKKWLLQSPSQGDFFNLLSAWRIWLLTVVLGALAGLVSFQIFPPPFRAQAVVIVDHNLEQAWPDAETERDLFTYLTRETRKLEAVAWSDATLRQVAIRVGGVTIADLRSGILKLSQPSDGAWLFWADDRDASHADELASSWAKAFTDMALAGIDNAIKLNAAQRELFESKGATDISELQENIRILEGRSLGISPYLQISLSQQEALPVYRSVRSGTYIFIGAISGFCITALAILLVGRRNEN